MSQKLFDPERSTISVNYFNQLRRRGKFLDLTIISKENHSVRAHRLVICAQFPSIENKLDDADSGKVEWKRFPSSIINSVIEFAYTGRIRINSLNVVRLYLLSQNLGCARLIAWCVHFIKTRIENLNLNEIWSVANVTANEELKGVCVCLMAKNFELYSRSKRFFVHTRVEDLRALLSNSEIRSTDATNKLSTISSWMAAADSATERVKRESEFENLLEDIDLGGLPKSFFIDLAMENTHIDLSEACKAILSSFPEIEGGINCKFLVPRRDNVAVLAFKDDIFIIGGRTQTKVSVSQVDKVDTRSGNITSVQSMLCRRDGASAVVSGQSIFVFGGYDITRRTTLSSCEKYDPSSNRMQMGPDLQIGRHILDRTVGNQLINGGIEAGIDKYTNFSCV
ncbi:hypothetical protein Aperf_G00000012964 [Anoplocephala perfoliata]